MQSRIWAWLPLAAALGLAAQPATAATSGLKQALDAAWTRQPEARALPARQDAARAAQRAAVAWTPEPVSLELSAKTDQLLSNQGRREVEVGIALPLWLPGERTRAGDLAGAELAATDSRALAARLRLAAVLRGSWWAWQRARAEAEAAGAQLEAARRIGADVARRVQAGDLARADQHQAEGAIAAAEAAEAGAQAARVAAALQFQALTGQAPAGPPQAEAAATAPPALEGHAALQELRDRLAVAERTAALAATQSRASPELTLAATRDRGGYGERAGQTVTLGLRLPFGSGPRHEGRLALARAEVLELQAQLAQQQASLQAEAEAAEALVAATQRQSAAAQRRAQLAQETRGFFDKSFRLGQTDLPLRLRIEAEAGEAERQAARARIEWAAAVSAQRQALGLLPE
ncbi:conserved exported hypothetical protein [Rubrivivax sp. A210]|uniref:TolC family protein n=1 Tax=Rubrivivax sp. A210 TaxID=2772301 RepID=UPI00191A5021|nr:TolC family protein [Rubrivivax sp. A210]CAD5372712.1 conserved exported hypothetical protein [Rubrivivax sp. A210]